MGTVVNPHERPFQPGNRVVITPDVLRFAGQHGKVLSIEGNHMYAVLLDGDDFRLGFRERELEHESMESGTK